LARSTDAIGEILKGGDPPIQHGFNERRDSFIIARLPAQGKTVIQDLQS
jgi:hypothetical protein